MGFSDVMHIQLYAPCHFLSLFFFRHQLHHQNATKTTSVDMDGDAAAVPVTMHQKSQVSSFVDGVPEPPGAARVPAPKYQHGSVEKSKSTGELFPYILF